VHQGQDEQIQIQNDVLEQLRFVASCSACLTSLFTDAAISQKASMIHLQQGQDEQIQMQKAAAEHQASVDRQEALDSMLCPRIGLEDIGYRTKPCCLDGTRSEIFISIAKWVSDFSTSLLISFVSLASLGVGNPPLPLLLLLNVINKASYGPNIFSNTVQMRLL
jgi:hypothetical protein